MAGRVRTEPTDKQKKWLEVYLSTQDPYEATRQAYDCSTEESVQEMTRNQLKSPTIRHQLIQREELEKVFSRKYLMRHLMEEIEDGSGAARVAAIRLAAELMGYSQKAVAAEVKKEASLSKDFLKRLEKAQISEAVKQPS